MKPDSSTSTETERLFQNIVIPKPRKYLRHYQYLIRRDNLPSIKVTILNKQLARMRCKQHEKIVKLTEDQRNLNRDRQTNNELEADSTTFCEEYLLFKNIAVLKPQKYRRHYQFVIRRAHLPAVKVTILNKDLARLRCKGYEKVIRMIEAQYIND